MPPLFSQRYGYTPASKQIQIKSVDDQLRAGLWNAVAIAFLAHAASMHPQTNSSPMLTQLRIIWDEYFKRPIDTIPLHLNDTGKELRDHFFCEEWFRVYDFIEFIASLTINPGEFRKHCNSVLERENSGYRFVSNVITPISDSTELQAIDDAIRQPNIFGGATAHLKSALALLSDRRNPDYRNSVKESISAIESLCRVLTGNVKATLGDALSILEKKQVLHGALRQSFSALYGYTSDEGGIRHAMLDELKLSFADAKYMLVASSGFINYLIGKVGELGYEIPKPAARGKP
jgi:hypothetical protein